MKVRRQIKTWVFSVQEIEKAAKQINTKKAGNRNELKIEHIIHAHPHMYCHIKKLFNSIIKHFHISVDFKLGVIVPVKKMKEKIMKMLIIRDLLH